MKKNIFAIISIVMCIFGVIHDAYAQNITTHVIDYENGVSSTSYSPCNIFAQPTSVSNFEHITAKNYPTYNSSEKAVSLKSKTQSSANTFATEFYIQFNFKKGNRYSIRLYAKSSALLPGGNPSIGITFSNTLGNIINPNTACNSAMTTIDANKYHNIYSKTTLNQLQYSWTNYLYAGRPTQDVPYLNIASFFLNGNAGITYECLLKKIEIIEESATPPTSEAPRDPSFVSINGTYVQNTQNGKIFLGIDDKYRQIDNPQTLFALTNWKYEIPSSAIISQPVDPETVGEVLGNLMLPSSSANAFLARINNSTHIYFIEKKLGPASSNRNYFLCRKITSEFVFNIYKFSQQNVRTHNNITFSTTLGLDSWVLGKDFTLILDDTPPPTQTYTLGQLVNMTTPPYQIYWGFDGAYRHIQNYETYTALFNTTDVYNFHTIQSGTIPQPQGNVLGGPGSQRYAFLAKNLNDGKNYFVERRLVNENDANSGYYNYCRYIYDINVFNAYHFDATKIENHSINFSTSPASNNWILGNNLTLTSTPPSSYVKGEFVNMTTSPYQIYWGFDGAYRHIQNYETYTALFNTTDVYNLYTIHSANTPQPQGNVIGGGLANQRYAFLANDLNDGKVYFVERRLVNENNVNSGYYNYCRHIYSMEAFNGYHFDATKIENHSISFSSSPAIDNWVLGPVIYD